MGNSCCRIKKNAVHIDAPPVTSQALQKKSNTSNTCCQVKEHAESTEDPTKSLGHHFSAAPQDVQNLILMKLAKDRESFVAFCFAQKSCLKVFKDLTFWRLLMEHEGRQIPQLQRGMQTLKLQDFFKLYFRLVYKYEMRQVSCNQKHRANDTCTFFTCNVGTI